MKIKTNAKCAGCTAAIIKALAPVAPAADWNLDLSSPDKVLTYTGSGNPDAAEVVRLIEKAGFKAEQFA